jgi:hypothetical protein
MYKFLTVKQGARQSDRRPDLPQTHHQGAGRYAEGPHAAAPIGVPLKPVYLDGHHI